ncbi:MAG: transposase [Bacteroidetes bacterium 4572_117]|nr:MAG: transposase [Bacteroidetes bacterium 4572_117]
MSNYTQIYWQIVFSTKYRKPVLLKENREKLFKYIWGILKNKECVLYRVNGIEDHIHIFTHVHPTIAISDLIKDIKRATNSYIKKSNIFPEFTAWQKGYGAFTYSTREKHTIINYVKNQEEHHNTISFIDEYKQLLKDNDVDFDENHLL